MIGKTVVLISGKAGAGKTTLANLLKNAFEVFDSGQQPVVASFAQPIKDVARSIGWGGSKDDKGRKLLQDLGRAGRAYDENLWVALLDRNTQYNNLVIVDDWRFPNEDVYLVSSGCTVVKLRVTGRSYDMGELGNDSSETALPNSYEGLGHAYYDLVVNNSEDELTLSITAGILARYLLKDFVHEYVPNS